MLPSTHLPMKMFAYEVCFGLAKDLLILWICLVGETKKKVKSGGLFIQSPLFQCSQIRKMLEGNFDLDHLKNVNIIEIVAKVPTRSRSTIKFLKWSLILILTEGLLSTKDNWTWWICLPRFQNYACWTGFDLFIVLWIKLTTYIEDYKFKDKEGVLVWRFLLGPIKHSSRILYKEKGSNE